MRPFSLPGLLLLLVSSLSAAAQSSVSIALQPPHAMTAERHSTWSAVITNRTDAAIDDLPYSISAAPSSLVEVPEGCVVRAGQVSDCTIDLPANGSRTITFTTRNAAATGHFGVVMDSFTGGALVYDEAVFGREFVVTSTADAGPGTLRQAILDINRECAGSNDPCVVVFRIDGPLPASGWQTIALLAPLPEITAPDVFIDGASQSRHTGDTRADAPELVLDGTAAGLGANGLFFRNGVARVADVAVGGFSENGIETHASRSMIVGVYSGVNPANVLLANGSRGVVFVNGGGYVQDSYLGGNKRSGGFFWTPADVQVLRNRVLANGASGLFFHRPAPSPLPSVARDNDIANNAHAGIALSLTATGDFARNNFYTPFAIDVGLDGVSAGTVPGRLGEGAIVGGPIITSARFENGVTTVMGRLAPAVTPVSSFQLVTIYAGVFGHALPVATEAVSGSEFTIRINRDLRGQTLRAALVTNGIYDADRAVIGTSEVTGMAGVEEVTTTPSATRAGPAPPVPPSRWQSDRRAGDTQNSPRKRGRSARTPPVPGRPRG